MAGGFGLAALSAALRFRIEQAIRAHDAAQVGNFAVVTRAPETLSEGAAPAVTTLTIYPYHLAPSATWRQMREPAYSTAGERRQDPWLALDVHYLLAAYGPDPDHERALGIAMLALHETPQLTAAMLSDAAENGGFDAASPLPQALRELAEQPAALRITPVHHPLDSASQVWSMMNGGLRTGMFYEICTLLMEQPRPRSSAPPVAEARLGVHQMKGPQITRLRFSPTAPPAAQWSDQPVASPADSIEISGSGLAAEVTLIRLGDRTIPVPAGAARSERIVAAVPADMRPGVCNLQVRHEWNRPEGAIPPPASGSVPVESSNLVPVAIRPVLLATPVTLSNRVADDGIVSFTATIRFAVAVGALQKVELHLTAINADANGRFAAFVFPGEPPVPGTQDVPVTRRRAAISGVPRGDYLVRVRVDGAESALTSGAGGYTGPILRARA